MSKNLKRLTLPLLIVGGIVTFITLALMLGGFQKLVNTAIRMVRLVNNTNTWDSWKVIPIPVYLRIRVFNITNPDEVQLGDKPLLRELGPYVYRETIHKEDITANLDADTVRYRQIKNYYFEPHLSSGTQEDIVTIINIPFVGVAKLAHKFTDDDFMLMTLDGMLSRRGERLMRRETVKDLLFDGFSVQAYIDLVNDPIVQSASEVTLPDKIMDGRMGFFEDKNGTASEWTEVLTGISNSADFGRVVAFKDKSSFSSYFSESCNAINGTDGILFEPFLQEGMSLYLIIPDLCRSIELVNTETVFHDGIPSYRFRQPQTLYASTLRNPENQCFCPIGDSCNIDGFLYVAGCFDGAPVMVSQPHFLFVQDDIRERVQGLEPDIEKHYGYVDLHPVTGVSLESRHRFQFNVEVKNYPYMPTFENVSDHILPIFWMEEGATLEGPNKDKLKLLTTVFTYWGIAQWILLLLGIFALPGIAFLLRFMQNKKDEVKLIIKSASVEKQVIG